MAFYSNMFDVDYSNIDQTYQQPGQEENTSDDKVQQAKEQV